MPQPVHYVLVNGSLYWLVSVPAAHMQPMRPVLQLGSLPACVRPYGAPTGQIEWEHAVLVDQNGATRVRVGNLNAQESLKDQTATTYYYRRGRAAAFKAVTAIPATTIQAVHWPKQVSWNMWAYQVGFNRVIAAAQRLAGLL